MITITTINKRGMSEVNCARKFHETFKIKLSNISTLTSIDIHLDDNIYFSIDPINSIRRIVDRQPIRPTDSHLGLGVRHFHVLHYSFIDQHNSLFTTQRSAFDFRILATPVSPEQVTFLWVHNYGTWTINPSVDQNESVRSVQS